MNKCKHSKQFHFIRTSVLIIVVLNSLYGCIIFRKEQIAEDLRRLPVLIQNIYYNIYEAPMFTGLDTLISFCDTLQGYPRFKDNVDVANIFRKHANDLVSAYDGDSTALTNLERSMHSSNQMEALILFSNIYDIDSIRAIRTIEKIIQTETDKTKKKKFQQGLSENRKHSAWEIAQQRERDSSDALRARKYKQVSDTEIYSVLNDGLHSRYLTPYDREFEIIRAALMRGSGQDYQFSRNMVIDALDSLYGAPGSASRHGITMYVKRLLSIPAPRDTINEKNQVMEIFNALCNGNIFNDPYFDSDWNRRHADTVKMGKFKYIIIDPKLAYLKDIYKGGSEIMPLTDSAFQSFTNRNGVIDYIRISITTYREYGLINKIHNQKGPKWYSVIPCGSDTDFPLKKVGNKWKLLIQKPLGIVW
jgi:hypothetical protein